MASESAWDACHDIYYKNQEQQDGQAVSPARSKASNASSTSQLHLWGSRSSIDRFDQDLDDGQDQDAPQPRPVLDTAAEPRPQAPVGDCNGSESPSNVHYGWRVSAAVELRGMIQREMERERDLPQVSGYLARLQAHAGDDFVTPQMRSIVTSWLSEVAQEFGMQQETLFLAVALLDMFQALSPMGVPRNVLQLVAVACMMVASKQDEVTHPTVDEFTEIAADAFKREDLLRMERLLLDQVDWRVKLPTSYGILHLITQALAGQLPPRAIALSAYLTELALLDYGTLEHAPSRIAAAAVAVGAACYAGASCPAALATLEQVTGYALADLDACAAQLLHLQQCAAAARDVPAYQPLAFVRDKYATDQWVCISRAPAAVAGANGLTAPAAMQQQHDTTSAQLLSTQIPSQA